MLLRERDTTAEFSSAWFSHLKHKITGSVWILELPSASSQIHVHREKYEIPVIHTFLVHKVGAEMSLSRTDCTKTAFGLKIFVSDTL